VASCGTALTTQQAQLLRRFTTKIVLSFDPDAAGQGAAAKSSELLVAEGFEVTVASLPAGDDPDTFIQKHGPRGYGERLKQSQPYLEYLLDRSAAGHDLNTDEGRVKFLSEMLPVAGRIPDAAMRDRFADRLAFKARVTDEVVRAEIRKTAVLRQTVVPKQGFASFGQLTKAEKGVLWWLIHEPIRALEALETLDPADLEGLASSSVLDLARKLNQDRRFSPSSLFEQLSGPDAQLVTAAASEREPHVHDVTECVRMVRRMRYERERTTVQGEIDRVQQRGDTASDLEALLVRKYDLILKIKALA
jgi:DNA primase